MKNFIISAAGVVGGVISSLYGGFTAAMTTLIIFMAVDWFSGMVCAGVFRSSRKSKSGGLSSKAGFRGLAKKCMIMLLSLSEHGLIWLWALHISRTAYVLHLL